MDVNKPEASETSARGGLPVMFWVIASIGAVLLFLRLLASFSTAGWGGRVTAIAVFAGYIVAAPIVWLIADWLRRIAMPSYLLTRGFVDTLGKKLFWVIGPQFAGIAILTWAAILLMPPIGPDHATSRAATKPTPSPTAATAPPPAAPPPAQTPPASAPTESRAAEPPAPSPQVATPAAAGAIPERTQASDQASYAAGRSAVSAEPRELLPPMPSTSVACTNQMVVAGLKKQAAESTKEKAEAQARGSLSEDVIAANINVSLTQIDDVRHDGPDNVVCAAILTIEIGPDLRHYGIASSRDETSYFVGRGPGGSITFDFGD